MDHAPDDELSAPRPAEVVHGADFTEDLDRLAAVEADLAAAEQELDSLDTSTATPVTE